MRRVLQLPLLFVAACIAAGVNGRSVADAANAPVKILASYGGEAGYQAPALGGHDL